MEQGAATSSAESPDTRRIQRLSAKQVALGVLGSAFVVWMLCRCGFGDPPAEAARVTAVATAAGVAPHAIDSLRGRRLGLVVRFFVMAAIALSVMALWGLLDLPRQAP
jgi:hypothetical protein